MRGRVEIGHLLWPWIWSMWPIEQLTTDDDPNTERFENINYVFIPNVWPNYDIVMNGSVSHKPQPMWLTRIWRFICPMTDCQFWRELSDPVSVHSSINYVSDTVCDFLIGLSGIRGYLLRVPMHLYLAYCVAFSFLGCICLSRTKRVGYVLVFNVDGPSLCEDIWLLLYNVLLPLIIIDYATSEFRHQVVFSY